MFLLKTPGGGGFGAADSDEPEASDRAKRRKFNTEVEKRKLPSSHVGRGSVFDYKRAQESA